MGRKKQYIIGIDTETTQPHGDTPAMVADFGAAVMDLKGNVVAQCAVMVRGVYDKPRKHPLFFTSDSSGIWSKAGQDRRYKTYNTMIDNGARMFATVPAINRWLAKAMVQYNPVLTAYNLPFDVDKMRNTGIDYQIFDRSFCLWSAAYTQWAHKKAYLNFVLQCHAFNKPTELGNMSFQTNAEIMARFVTGNSQLPNEPHTAIEDLLDYEFVILRKLLKKRTLKWLLNEPRAYNWRETQVNNWFIAK